MWGKLIPGRAVGSKKRAATGGIGPAEARLQIQMLGLEQLYNNKRDELDHSHTVFYKSCLIWSISQWYLSRHTEGGISDWWSWEEPFIIGRDDISTVNALTSSYARIRHHRRLLCILNVLAAASIASSVVYWERYTCRSSVAALCHECFRCYIDDFVRNVGWNVVLMNSCCVLIPSVVRCV